ncbi:MAG: cation:proton antiporter [Lachnospiraceae bacterium]|nr:cation:proton antiporter [Lachnospiraceae bacterium]
METYLIFRDLAIILIAAKCFGILARALKAPQVVGEIIAGLVIGPCMLGLVNQSDFIVQMAEIGVVMLMFNAGLGTDLKELLKTGPVALIIACAGVFVPLVLGTLLYMGFYGAAAVGSEHFVRALFIGTIMTATSVSITVAALKELGYLKGRVGTTIVSAAIIDDVIGIIVLTFVIGMKSSDSNPASVILKTAAFFVITIIGGVIIYKLFALLDKKYPHTQRIPILSFGVCLIFSYLAERYFGIADITGAYVAGLVLCNLHDSDYIEKKIDISSYMFFAPIFFVGIGLKTTLNDLNGEILLFSIAFVLVALFAKIIGCGIVSRLSGFSIPDSLKIGIGMMTRGEVALVVAQKGLTAGLVEPIYFTSVILLIIVSSIATPILLKLLYAKYPERIAAAQK